MEYITYFFQYGIFFYTFFIVSFYILLALFSYYNNLRSKLKYTEKEEEELKKSPDIAPGISVVAPAFNEEVIIIDNVQSFLNLDYPNFEVIIVNDGSKDKTLELLIEHFELQEIVYPYIQKIHSQPVKRIFKSKLPKHKRLTVIDKINGGTKADAINAGINMAQYDYFINTDVDCILSKQALVRVMLPVMHSKIPVIAVGGTMRMVNGCKVEYGEIIRVSPPKQLIPLFQETEYLRSYLVAKMGWSLFNLIPNVSGGFGLFHTDTVIQIGGYDPLSHAEDMDMTIRMATYMRDNKKKYRMVHVPHTCCWTEGPPNTKILQRQRSRWGRGLFQVLVVHRRIMLNPRYGRLGMFVLPYILFFEFLAPLIELVGVAFLIFLLLTRQVNFETFWLMILLVYMIGVTFSIVTISYDLTIRKLYNTYGEYFKLILYSSIEAFVYHPLIVVFGLRGYWQFITRKNFSWGEMTRQGYAKSTTSTA